MAEKGIRTDKELSEKIGLSQQQISFRLKNKLSVDTMERLSLFFKTTVKEMLR